MPPTDAPVAPASPPLPEPPTDAAIVLSPGAGVGGDRLAAFGESCCLNCGCERVERFCPRCGQEAKPSVAPLRDLAHELAGEALHWDSKLWATLRPLVTRPGRLTVEYLAGRRAPYITPARLYLAVSAIYFLLFAATGSDRVMKESMTNGMKLGADRQMTRSAGAPPAPPTSPALSTSRPTAPPARPAADPAKERRRRIADRMMERMQRAGVWFVENLNIVSLLSLPVYALSVAVLYRRQRRLFAEHMVFTLHTQSFALLTYLPMYVLPTSWRVAQSGGTVLMLTVLPVYTAFALRTVYGRGHESRAKTVFKAVGFVGAQMAFSFVLMMLVFVVLMLLP